MHIIFALVAAAALLCLWLTGHWFARVLAFLTFAAIFGLFGWFFSGGYGPLSLMWLLAGVGLAWPVSGIPIYYYRHRAWGDILPSPHLRSAPLIQLRDERF